MKAKRYKMEMRPKEPKKTLLARKYLVSGRVQGVGFRYFSERSAKSLGVCGYVRNLASGEVEVYAVGDERQLLELKNRLARGPHGARVMRVEEFEEPVNAGYTRFRIEA